LPVGWRHGPEDVISAAMLCCNMNLVSMTMVFEPSYCNVYGTGYQLRYVYRNNGSGIAVEYITGTSNLYQIWGCHTYFLSCLGIYYLLLGSFYLPPEAGPADGGRLIANVGRVILAVVGPVLACSFTVCCCCRSAHGSAAPPAASGWRGFSDELLLVDY
jgi:hypothetical protein